MIALCRRTRGSIARSALAKHQWRRRGSGPRKRRYFLKEEVFSDEEAADSSASSNAVRSRRI